MSEVDAFLDRMDAIAIEQPGATVPDGSDESVEANGAAMRPFIERLAERACIELPELIEALASRIPIPVAVTARRVDAGHGVDAELTSLAIATTMQGFLWGVAWEQHRQLPAELRDLGVDGGD